MATNECKCGCFAPTKGGTFLPGHDAKLLAWIKTEVSLAWGDHIRNQEPDDPAFKLALKKAFSQIPAENTNLSKKFGDWVLSHLNWEPYLTRMWNR